MKAIRLYDMTDEQYQRMLDDFKRAISNTITNHLGNRTPLSMVVVMTDGYSVDSFGNVPSSLSAKLLSEASREIISAEATINENWRHSPRS